MKRYYVPFLPFIIYLLITFLFITHLVAQAPVVQTFSYTGATQTFVVPPCAGSMTIDLKGASGGPGSPNAMGVGTGGGMTVVITPTPGQTMYMNVGGQGSVLTQGFNGGGPGGAGSTTSGGGGGGASDVRIGGNALADRKFVAGGGGGAGGSGNSSAYGGFGGTFFVNCISPYGAGGTGGMGGATGGTGNCAGGTATGVGTGGAGGGLTSGGGPGGTGAGSYGGAGVLGIGGGGGGGYYGGGGGMSGSAGQYPNGGGGGGSSYLDSTLISFYEIGGMWSGDGYVRVTYSFIGSLPVTASSLTICSGGTSTLIASGMSTYTWLPSGAFAGSNSASIAVSPPATTAYTVTGTSSLGCATQSIVTIYVQTAPPTLTITGVPGASICPGMSVTLLAAGATTYSWTGGISNGVPFGPALTTTYTVSGQNACGITQAARTVTVLPLVVTAVASPSAICLGNTATLSASPGIGSYTWQPIASSAQSLVVSPLSGLIYTVSASNGTCVGSATIALAVNPQPTVMLYASQASVCIGQMVSIAATGASSYTWALNNQTVSAISDVPSQATVYSVTGTGFNGCTSGASLLISVNPTPTVTAVSSQSLVCTGGSVTLTAGGASSYTWSNGSWGATQDPFIFAATIFSVFGSYSITNCASMQTVIVNTFDPQLTTSPDATICLGSQLVLSASGGNAGSYNWSNGSTAPSITVSPALPSTYMVSAFTTSGVATCSTTAFIQVLVNPLPAVNIAAASTILCLGEPGLLLTASGAITYSWNTAATTASLLAAPSASTIYTVTGFGANGCNKQASIQVNVSTCTGINGPVTAASSFQIYPNPTTGRFLIRSEGDQELLVINSLGQQIKNLVLSGENNHLAEISDLPAGLYFIRLKSGQGPVQKVLVEK